MFCIWFHACTESRRQFLGRLRKLEEKCQEWSSYSERQVCARCAKLLFARAETARGSRHFYYQRTENNRLECIELTLSVAKASVFSIELLKVFNNIGIKVPIKIIYPKIAQICKILNVANIKKSLQIHLKIQWISKKLILKKEGSSIPKKNLLVP